MRTWLYRGSVLIIAALLCAKALLRPRGAEDLTHYVLIPAIIIAAVFLILSKSSFVRANVAWAVIVLMLAQHHYRWREHAKAHEQLHRQEMELLMRDAREQIRQASSGGPEKQKEAIQVPQQQRP